MIPYGRQDITQADIDAVVEVLRSDFLTQGPMVPRFEEMIASHCGAAHAVATSNATSALHIACLALGLGKGDRLWTSPITFVASANCALYCGASVDFVDIDSRTGNLCPRSLRTKLERAKREGSLPKVVIPVHFGGQSCEMAEIHALSREYGFRIVEDASHAIGGTYKGQPIGSCLYSDITVFSFHPVKIITTAEGGAALTRDAGLAEKMALLRSHGITRDAGRMIGVPGGGWYYEQIELGYNYRMTDLQAALGVSQMSRLNQYVMRRHELSKRYDEALSGLPLTVPWQNPDTYSALHLYVVGLHGDRVGKTRREVFDELRINGIGVNVHYIPVHLQPYFQGLGFSPGDFPEAERYYTHAISLPMYASLTDSQQDEVISTLRRVLAS